MGTYWCSKDTVFRTRFSLSMEVSRLTRDGTAEPVPQDQILRHARRQGNIHFPVQLTTGRIGHQVRPFPYRFYLRWARLQLACLLDKTSTIASSAIKYAKNENRNSIGTGIRSAASEPLCIIFVLLLGSYYLGHRISTDMYSSRYNCCCCFSHSAHWLPTRKKLLYTVANPARGLLNREKKKKKKSLAAPPPPPRALLVRRKKKKKYPANATNINI